MVAVASQKKSCDGRNIAGPLLLVDTAGNPARERSVARIQASQNFIGNAAARKLSLLVFIQVIFVTMVYGPIAAYLVEAFPAQDPIHRPVASLSHRERSLWRTAATRWTVRRCADRQHLRGFVLPHRRCVHHIRGWIAASERNASREDLEGTGVGRI